MSNSNANTPGQPGKTPEKATPKSKKSTTPVTTPSKSTPKSDTGAYTGQAPKLPDDPNRATESKPPSYGPATQPISKNQERESDSRSKAYGTESTEEPDTYAPVSKLPLGGAPKINPADANTAMGYGDGAPAEAYEDSEDE